MLKTNYKPLKVSVSHIYLSTIHLAYVLLKLFVTLTKYLLFDVNLTKLLEELTTKILNLLKGFVRLLSLINHLTE